MTLQVGVIGVGMIGQEHVADSRTSSPARGLWR